MKDTVQHVVDAKILASATTSGLGALATTAEELSPIVDLASGLVAIVAGTLAIVWTVIRIYDRYKGN